MPPSNVEQQNIETFVSLIKMATRTARAAMLEGRALKSPDRPEAIRAMHDLEAALHDLRQFLSS
jgi:hypothetical protein